MATRESRNVRNNNPLNIRENDWANDDWVGEHKRDLDSQFEEFIDPEHGFRAAYKIINRYRKVYNLYSINAIIKRFAPKSENDTNAYVDYLTEKLNKLSWTPVWESEMPDLLFWMAEYEGAKGAFTMEQVLKGIQLANE